jgi:D-threo-aldose 1-dehydrogenase
MVEAQSQRGPSPLESFRRWWRAGINCCAQAGERCFAECEARGIAVHVAGVFASGVLASAEPANATYVAQKLFPWGSREALLFGVLRYSYCKADPAVLARVEAWRSLATRHGLALPAVAIAFATLPVCVTRVVLGIASAEQVAANLLWVEQSANVPMGLWAEAKEAGLLAATVPIPPC